ncbi:PC4 and SFRS1-interacting protein [Homalodisca vitripennis]|nr:PC4 and SFRS1-interacting protein [Homalodisca vitripennis]
MDGKTTVFSAGDLVFAKVKGCAHWPATVNGIITKVNSKSLKYSVIFFGTSETATVKQNDICLYSENVQRLGQRKSDNHRNYKFNKALEEAEMNFNLIKNTISVMTPNRYDSSLQSELEEACFSDSLPKFSSNDGCKHSPSLQNSTKLIENSLIKLESILVDNNFLENANKEEDNLQIAAKIGSALLEKNKLLEEKNIRLEAMLGSMEEKIEALEENEQKHLTKIEALSVELTHSLSQLCKEKQFHKEMQKMFEEQDIKSQQTIESYYTKIKNLEKSLLTLQRNKSDDKNDQEPKIDTSTQTSIEVTPPPATQSLSVNSEMLILKRRQDQLEQQMSALLDNTHLHLNESGRILPTNFIASKSTQQCKHKDDPLDSTLNKSTSGNKRKSGVRRDAKEKTSLVCLSKLKNIKTTTCVTSVLDTHGVAKASVIKPPINARSRTKDESIEEFYTTNIDYYISIMTNNQLPNADCIESNSFTFNSRPPISQQSPSESGQRSPPRAEDEQDKYFLDKTGLSNFKMKTALPYPN